MFSGICPQSFHGWAPQGPTHLAPRGPTHLGPRGPTHLGPGLGPDAAAGAGAAGRILRSQPDPSPNAPRDQIRRKDPCCDLYVAILEHTLLPTQSGCNMAWAQGRGGVMTQHGTKMIGTKYVDPKSQFGRRKSCRSKGPCDVFDPWVRWERGQVGI